MGTGLHRMYNECKRQNIKMDIETNGLFIVSFKNGVVNGVVNDVVNGVVNKEKNDIEIRQKKLLDYLENNKKIKLKEYINLVGISYRTAQRDLTLFKNKRLVKFTGAPKTGFYQLS